MSKPFKFKMKATGHKVQLKDNKPESGKTLKGFVVEKNK